MTLARVERAQVLTTTMHRLSLCPRRGRPISRIVRGCQEPYPRLDMHGLVGGNIHDARKSGTCTGAAWLSSARAVRCRVKSFNERNPCRQLPAFSWGLWRDRRRQAGGRRGRRQVIMAFMSRAAHVLQCRI